MCGQIPQAGQRFATMAIPRAGPSGLVGRDQGPLIRPVSRTLPRPHRDVIVHMEIAEKEGRTAPGVQGDDFRPYFQVLKKAGYHGAISLEGRWKMEQLPKAFETILEQAK